MKNWNYSAKTAGIAILLALAATFWLAIWPSFYHGVAAEGAAGQVGDVEQRRFTRSLIDVNGPVILLVLAFPVMLCVVGMLIGIFTDLRQRASKIMLWTNAAVLAAFCLIALASIGMFYVPAAIALVTAAALSGVAQGPPSRQVRRRQSR